MSVYYNVTEHLKISKGYENAANICDLVRDNVWALGTMMLLDEAWIFSASVTNGDRQLVFDKQMSLDEVKSMLAFIPNFCDDESADMKIDLTYSYVWRTGRDGLGLGPFAVTEYLDELDETGLDGLFYTMYNNADCGDGAGIVCAYGTANDGSKYKGTVDYGEASSVSPDGNWDAPITSIIMDPEHKYDKQTTERALAICEGLMDNFDPDSRKPELQDGCISFTLDNAHLDGAKNVAKFSSLLGELIRLMDNGNFNFMTEFVDTSGDNPRLMKIEFDTDGNASYFVAGV